MTSPATVDRAIGGFDVVETRTETLVATLRQRLAQRTPTELLFANTNFVVACQQHAADLAGPETLIVNDGIGMDLASRMLYGKPFVENLNGTDFVPRFLREVGVPLRLFLLGARPPSLVRAAAVWSACAGIEVVGAIDGYAGMADPDAVIAQLRGTRPDVLLLALGDPRQAGWIVEHRGRHGVPVVIAVGALFDFVTGRVSRAPALVRRLRCEWLYRLAQEPGRLLRRYTIDLAVFFAVCRAHGRARRAAQARA